MERDYRSYSRNEGRQKAILALAAAAILFLSAKTGEAKASGYEVQNQACACNVQGGYVNFQFADPELSEGRTYLRFSFESIKENFSLALEASEDGESFSVLSYYELEKGNESRQFSYSLETGKTEHSFYRLRRINSDGSGCIVFSTHADIRETAIQSLAQLPNPGHQGEKGMLLIESKSGTKAHIHIEDGLGKTLADFCQELRPGENHVVLPTEKLDNGIYVLQVSEGGVINRQRIFIR